jgi:NAD(P)-dependent dehydrogenase (short-subunit alcohol dehydrogenase family)
MRSDYGPMTGKTCVVTGATAGIGQVTARELARMGASVVIISRNTERCAATADQIRNETGNPLVTFIAADLSSQAETHRVAREILERHDQLHILVNNAGAMFADRRESVDGIELTLALNHVGYFLLTTLLLDRLRASAPARVVSVASDAHRICKRFDFDDPEARTRYRAFRAYAQSKLANILFARELARRLSGTGVTSNALHPGFVASSFMAGNGLLGWVMRRAASVLAISNEEGAKTSICLATAPELASVTGQYFEKQKSVASSAAANDAEAAARLWDFSEKLTSSQ